jgi:hypothetical protein
MIGWLAALVVVEQVVDLAQLTAHGALNFGNFLQHGFDF